VYVAGPTLLWRARGVNAAQELAKRLDRQLEQPAEPGEGEADGTSESGFDV
jgi:hypothetical protein